MTQLRKNDARSRYELIEGEQVLGFVEFRADAHTVTLPHTEVASGHEGEGLGGQLARYALEDVRAQGKQVVPSCPFIAAYIGKHPEYAGLVAEAPGR